MSFTVRPFETADHPRWAADGRQAPPTATAPGPPGLWSHDSEPWEAQLVRRVARGDHEAFGALYDHFSKPLYSFAVRTLNDRREAEDVLQEVFLQIWEKAPLFDEAAGKPSSWVVRMTRNKAIDRLRARRRRLEVFEEGADTGVMAETPGATQPVENGGQDEAAQIRAAVNELPPDQRQSIHLAFFGGLTHMEIAEALEEPLGTIKARIRRGMLRLRDGLEGRLRPSSRSI